MYCRLQPHAPILQPYALWLQPCAHSPATQCIPGLQPCASQACNPVHPRPATLCVPGASRRRCTSITAAALCCATWSSTSTPPTVGSRW